MSAVFELDEKYNLEFPDGFPAYHVVPPPNSKRWLGHNILLFKNADRSYAAIHVRARKAKMSALRSLTLKGFQPAQMYTCSLWRENKAKADDALGLSLEAAKPAPVPIRLNALGEPLVRVKHGFKATPFVMPEAAQIPRRPWLYGKTLERGQMFITAAASGVGKSTLSITEALAISTGRALLNVEPVGKLCVHLWNGEDGLPEMTARITAAAQHYGIKSEDFEGRLFVDSGIDSPVSIATQGSREGVSVNANDVQKIIDTLRDKKVDVLIVDPFVSSHAVSENDNSAMQAVSAAWTKIAQKANCAVHLIHHTRKVDRGNQIGVDDLRGASAVLAAARGARSLNVMSEVEAANAGVADRSQYVSITQGKSSHAPLSARQEWFQSIGESLGNRSDGLIDDSDWVGVAVPWTWPAQSVGTSPEQLEAVRLALEDGGPYLVSPRSPNWVGYPIAAAMGMDLEDRAQKKRVTKQIESWFGDGFLIKVEVKTIDSKIVQAVQIGELPC